MKNTHTQHQQTKQNDERKRFCFYWTVALFDCVTHDCRREMRLRWSDISHSMCAACLDIFVWNATFHSRKSLQDVYLSLLLSFALLIIVRRKQKRKQNDFVGKVTVSLGFHLILSRIIRKLTNTKIENLQIITIKTKQECSRPQFNRTSFSISLHVFNACSSHITQVWNEYSFQLNSFDICGMMETWKSNKIENRHLQLWVALDGLIGVSVWECVCVYWTALICKLTC